ncbi:superoxide dismutase [Thelonectria olida]|uniref:superoxide dismutase n=1 Tax=Thelonectria olida TaxID=1576542 RepID=A0A9P8WFU8_9HYPO|nr:superoxide dismutase [Thelonectria olida]
MRASISVAALLTTLVGQVAGQNAEPVTDNPVGVTYKATLPDEPFFKLSGLEGNVKGYISAVANKDGDGVDFSVILSNLPKEGGPFIYHVHVDPVPEDGNCTKTLAHLDPFERGEATPCDSTQPESCQVGDLSGKHGSIQTDPFEAHYLDLYASTKEGIGAFFGNRSIVIHYANKTRLTCANFVMTGGSEPSSTPSSTMIPSEASSMLLPGSVLLAGAFALLAAL